MRDEPGVAWVLETLDEPGDDVEAFHHVPQHDRPRFPRSGARAPFQAQRAIELRTE